MFGFFSNICRIWSKIDQKWNITKLLNILIQSKLFKRSNFQVISQCIHIKDISKVNDNGNQYKQKLILWYWTKNYFLMGFTAWSYGSWIYSTNKTDRHDITEILLKVALNTIKQTYMYYKNMITNWDGYIDRCSWFPQ